MDISIVAKCIIRNDIPDDVKTRILTLWPLGTSCPTRKARGNPLNPPPPGGQDGKSKAISHSWESGIDASSMGSNSP